MFIREQLSPKVILFKHRLNNLAFEYVIETIYKLHMDSLIQPNEMVGPIAAQSIGEPATQMTLNTFHFAGISEKSNVTRGVPRLKELLHLSKTLKAPSLTIYLDDDISSTKTSCQQILNQIELTLLNDILLSINVFYDPDDKNTLVEEDKDLLQIYSMFSGMDEVLTEEDCGSKWIIRLEFDKEKILNKDITMEMIYHKMSIQFPDEVNCVYSDDNSSKLIFRMRLIKDKKTGFDKINDLNYIKTFIKNLREKVVIKGISDINSVSMFKNNKYVLEDKSWKQKEEWVLDTNGINLIEILQHPKVDNTRTLSNDVYEVLNTFGIEAAREVIMSEIREVIDGAGSYVNYRHLNLLCDIMTHKGALMSIDRFGINRAATGPLAKCSFEETTDQLFKAAVFGEADKLNGVSANIMMGQLAPAGTGNCEILLDESKLTDMLYKGEEDIGDISTWGDKLDYCDENIGIDFDVSGLEALEVPEVSVI
jgi:DNA-directed RNA polymerase II subunit RPB1